MSIDQFISNLFIKYLSNTTSDQTSKAIQSNLDLFASVSEEDWIKYRSWKRWLPGVEISYSTLIASLQKNRPDILSTICSTPGGVEWLEQNINKILSKLKDPPKKHFIRQ